MFGFVFARATQDVRRRLQKPRTTVDRQLQSLHMLGVLTCNEQEIDRFDKIVTVWRYRVTPGIRTDALACPEMSPHTVCGSENRAEPDTCRIPTDISGQADDREEADVRL